MRCGPSFPAGAFAQAAGPETNKVTLGFIALTDASPLIIAKEKKLFDKYGITDAKVAKQASWGTTRDNMVLGSGGGRHRRRPYPDALALPDLARHRDGGEQADADVYPGAAQLPRARRSRSPRSSRAAGAKADASPLKEAFAKKKAAGQEVKCAMTFPGGTHDMWIRYWLAAGGIDPDKDVSTIVVPPPQMVANMKVGNMDGLLRRRAVERPARAPGHRLHRLHDRRDLEGPSREVARHARRLGRQEPQGRHGRADGRDGGPAVVREDGEQGRAGQHHRQAPMVQRAAGRHHQPHQGRHRLRRRPQGQRLRPADEVLEGRRLLSLPEPRAVVPHREPALGQAADGPRHQGDHRQGQPRGPVARGRQEHQRRRRRHPQDHVARQGDLLRRQGVRSRPIPRPISPACRSRRWRDGSAARPTPRRSPPPCRCRARTAEIVAFRPPVRPAARARLRELARQRCRRRCCRR